MGGGVKGWPGPTTAWGLTLLMVLCLAGSVQAESVTLQVTPAVVEVNSFYQGCEVTVTGTIPAGHQAVVELVGPFRQEHLMRKGRRGMLWMNVGEVTVSGAPSLYLVQASAADLLAGSSPWGFRALIQHLTLAGQVQEQEKAEFQEQFLELKKSERLYASSPQALKISPAGNDRLKVTGKFWLPANVKPDTYKVCLTAVGAGRAVDQQCTALPIKMVGFPALIMSLAYQHSAIYGIIAIVIAILTGGIMGFLFKGGGGH
jgi:hypothetical protein